MRNGVGKENTRYGTYGELTPEETPNLIDAVTSGEAKNKVDKTCPIPDSINKHGVSSRVDADVFRFMILFTRTQDLFLMIILCMLLL